MSTKYDGEELPIRRPRRAQTLPVRFATDIDPYPPSGQVAEGYIRNPFISRREPYSARIIDPEIHIRRLQPRHSRESDWAIPRTDSEPRFAPPVERHRNHAINREYRYQKSSFDSDNDSDVVIATEEHSPERSRNRGLEHFDADLKERAVKERLRRVRNRSGNPYQGDFSSSDSETDSLDYFAGYSFSLSRHTRSPLSEDGTVTSASELPGKDPKTTERQSFENGAQAGKVYGILQSRYTGDGVIGGLQTAKLTFTHDAAPGIRKGPSPVFRWA